MATLKTPGLQFYAEQVDLTTPTYDPLDLESGPRRNELYTVCNDGSIRSVHEPSRPIGWELIEDGYEWFYRATQMNQPLKRCIVRYHSSAVVSHNAEISEQKDDGDEVESQLIKIATIDPLLAHCAVLVGDPVQTSAMAKFAEGKMSYAEMRGLCG